MRDLWSSLHGISPVLVLTAFYLVQHLQNRRFPLLSLGKLSYPTGGAQEPVSFTTFSANRYSITSANGTGLLLRDVSFDGEFRRVTGPSSGIGKFLELQSSTVNPLVMSSGCIRLDGGIRNSPATAGSLNIIVPGKLSRHAVCLRAFENGKTGTR
jgi:hypothetical protein